jgi:hypothetical protein
VIAPFLVDPSVLASIRRMTRRDVPAVARLHGADMGNSLWARLGPRFLETLYGGLLESRFFLGFVYEENGEIGGFIAATLDGGRMFREVLRRRGLPLALRAFLAVLRSPTLLLPLLATPFYFRRSGDEIAAESLFCSFVPRLRGRRVSGHINKVLFDELAWHGHSQVKITTEVDNEGAVRQLTSWGFERRGTFHFYGKTMALFVLDLAASPRVEPRRLEDG